VTILRQSGVYIATLAICLTSSLLIVLWITVVREGGTFQIAWDVWQSIVFSPWFLAALPAGLLLVVPVRFFFALNQKLGPGVLRKWMLGHYHEPREEHRIFMFLDMKDSTTLAEQLGNLKFSALVRDFFQDLTLPVLQTRAEVSHYIGDEAVLTWTVEKGAEGGNCVRLFFEFEKAISRRAAYYRSAYGLVPEFKAGAHVGLVVATEVGQVKSEIVFHGDVLNTAARIQGLCNETGEGLLVSQQLFQAMEMPSNLAGIPLGSFELKGKEQAVAIVAIRSN
jgi:adenylate cyclase